MKNTCETITFFHWDGSERQAGEIIMECGTSKVQMTVGGKELRVCDMTNNNPDGVSFAKPGDWILRGVGGSCFVVSDLDLHTFTEKAVK